jgi:hypothetical protein
VSGGSHPQSLLIGERESRRVVYPLGYQDGATRDRAANRRLARSRLTLSQTPAKKGPRGTFLRRLVQRVPAEWFCSPSIAEARKDAVRKL